MNSIGFATGLSYPAALINKEGQVVIFDAATMNIDDQTPVATYSSKEFSGGVAVAPNGSCVYVSYGELDQEHYTIRKLVPSALTGGTAG